MLLPQVRGELLLGSGPTAESLHIAVRPTAQNVGEQQDQLGMTPTRAAVEDFDPAGRDGDDEPGALFCAKYSLMEI